MREAGAVIELTSLFIGSSQARRTATQAGVRYLAMPGVRLETFRDDGPLAVDFDAIRGDAERIGDAWGQASTFRLTTPAGTDLRGSVQGRPGRVLHGLARDDGDYMAPPDIEAGTAPVEASSEGDRRDRRRPVVHGAGAAALARRAPVFAAGELVAIEGEEAGRLQEMLARCADDRMAQPRRGLDGVQPVGDASAAFRWRRNRPEARRTSRSGTRSRTAGRWMPWRIWTA